MRSCVPKSVWKSSVEDTLLSHLNGILGLAGFWPIILRWPPGASSAPETPLAWLHEDFLSRLISTCYPHAIPVRISTFDLLLS